MISLPQLRDPPPTANCGPCHACCDVCGVDALGKPHYARCAHLRPNGAPGACGVYGSRPGQCADYRCAWHLGLLGERTDRRPNECGVLFQLEPVSGGRWRLAAYEARPGELLTERTAYLVRQILTSKKTRHLALLPEVMLVPYGADLPMAFAVSDLYAYTLPPREIPTRPHGQMKLWDGAIRDLLMPKTRDG